MNSSELSSFICSADSTFASSMSQRDPVVQIFYLSNIYGMSEYCRGRRGHRVNSLVSVVALVLQIGDVLVAQQVREVGDDNWPALRLQRRHYHRRSGRLSEEWD